MIETLKKPYTQQQVEKILNSTVKKWFFTRFKSFSLPQLYGVIPIHNRENILVSAPTGATKTLTGFLAILNELVDSAEKGILEDKIYCVYVSPLKALNTDIAHNLIEPLKEIEEIAGKKLGIRVAVRTGDTTASEKQKMLKNPPHILITTPESLAIILSSIKFIQHLQDIQWMITDEIHALADSKRGVHLSLSLERLDSMAKHMTRIGLSATVAPIEEIAKFLVGYKKDKPRNCKIVDVQFIKQLDLKVLSPLKDLIDTTPEQTHEALYNLIDHLIQTHKTTLIFTNTRAATERVVDHLKNKFPKNYTENIAAHHGSLSKEHRVNVEEKLRQGKLKCVVCLDSSTKILNSDGCWVSIKDLNKSSVQSLNKSLKLSSNKILNKFKIKNKEKLLKLKTNLGKEILCTKDHKFLTINKNGILNWKEAASLNENDFIAAIRKYDFKEFKKNDLKKFIFDNYPKQYFVNLNNSFLKILRKAIKSNFKEYKTLWKNYFSKESSYSIFLSNINGKYSFNIGSFKKLIKLLNLDETKAFDNISNITSDKYKMPKIIFSSKFLRLIGFMLAEGYFSDRDFFVSNRNKDLLNHYAELIKKVSGKKPFMKMGSTGTPILVWSSKFLCEFLKNLGFKSGRKARIVNIPSFMFRLNSNLIFSFLSGYLDGDGYLEVKKDGRVYSAGFCTTSKTMSEDIMKLLLRENIVSSIRSRYYDEVQNLNGRKIIKKGWFYCTVILGGSNLRIFAKNIAPIRPNLKRIKQVLNLSGYSNLDVIPNIGNRLRKIRSSVGLSTYKLQKLGLNPVKYELGTKSIKRDQLKKLLSFYKKSPSLLNLSDSDIFWEKIKSKKEVDAPSFVYNIEVENDHNYIANGLITKNCSTSLELGIDIGYIDLVILLSSPKSVARALQRIGRSGHQLHENAKGRLLVMDRDDLIECAVLLKSAIEKKIDKIHIPTNALDVLAQQIIGIALEGKIHTEELYDLIRQSYCYKDLKREDFNQIIDYLAGKFISLEDRHIYARIWHDEETGMIGRKGKLGRVIYMTNIGTIPDESFITVKIGNQTIGHLDEAFVEKLKPGDVFVLGGETYTFKFSRGMVVQVSASTQRPPTVPRWFSEMLPLSFDLANEIGKFRKLMNEKFCSKKKKQEIIDFILDYLYVDKNAANAIYQYFYEEFNFAQIPSNTRIIVEHTKDARGNVIVFHTLFGRRVNDCLSRAVAFAISRTEHKDVEIGINDNGFYVRSDKKFDLMKAFNRIKSKELRKVMEFAIERTEVMKRRFRHCATRALMILRTYKGKQKRVGRQQVGSMILMSALKRIDENFSILKEARREVLEDLMDIENTKVIIKGIENKNIKLEEIHTDLPSPFAFNLIVQGYTDILKMEDRIEFLKRMHNNVLAKISLKKNIY